MYTIQVFFQLLTDHIQKMQVLKEGCLREIEVHFMEVGMLYILKKMAPEMVLYLELVILAELVTARDHLGQLADPQALLMD